MSQQTEWRSYVSMLAEVDRRPRGFISITDFAERCLVSQPSVRQAALEQRIPKRCCVAVRGRGRDSKKQVYINWNEAGYRYILSRPPEFWPDDFSPNVQMEYRPIVVNVEPSLDEQAQELVDGNNFGTINGAIIRDLPDAKLEFEKLRIKKLEAEVNEIHNETIRIKDVVEINREMAVELRACLQTIINKLPPKIVACKTVQSCRQMLRAGFTEAFTLLEGLYDGEAEEESSAEDTTDSRG